MFNIQKFIMVLALRWVFCVDQRTGSGLCCIQRWAKVGVQLLVWEKDVQIIIIRIVLLTQRMSEWHTALMYNHVKCSKLPATFIYTYNLRINAVSRSHNSKPIFAHPCTSLTGFYNQSRKCLQRGTD